jgi:hypothetical protein
LKACPPRPVPKVVSTGKVSTGPTVPIRGARGAAPRTRSAPALADGAAIRIITRTRPRAAKSTRVGTR